jgi:hypothetical protein
MTLVHETGHEVNKYGAPQGENENGNVLYTPLPNGYSSDEQGSKAEENIWGTADYKPFSNPSLEPSKNGVLGLSPEKYQPGVTEDIIKQAQKTEEGRMTLPTLPTMD